MKNKLPLKFYPLFLLEFLSRFVMWAIVPFALLFARKATKEEVEGKLPYNHSPEIQRYKFPTWLDWIDTPDDWFVCYYEPTMLKIHNKWGWRVAAWINLSFRNVMMSLTWSMAIPVSNYWYAISDQEKQEKGLFDNHYHFLGLTLKVGYVSYRNWKNYKNLGMYLAVPRITVRIKEKEITE